MLSLLCNPEMLLSSCCEFMTDSCSCSSYVEMCLKMSAFSGSEIIVEEFLDGEEASFFALIDGNNCVALASAQVASQYILILALPRQ